MTCPRPLERLSHRQREATPLAFAAFLLGMVRGATGARKVAVLWVQARTVYGRLPHVDLWGRDRDANLYDGPWPVICHPPCGPWGKYRHRCRQCPVDAINAMRMVHRWGGVVEQPVGSSLFREHGGGGQVISLNQWDFGHLALKPTMLYLVASAESKDA